MKPLYVEKALNMIPVSFHFILWFVFLTPFNSSSQRDKWPILNSALTSAEERRTHSEATQQSSANHMSYEQDLENPDRNQDVALSASYMLAGRKQQETPQETQKQGKPYACEM